jgi:hypothetical protein
MAARSPSREGERGSLLESLLRCGEPASSVPSNTVAEWLKYLYGFVRRARQTTQFIHLFEIESLQMA